MSEGTNTITRNAIADYLNLGTAETPNWVLMGTGFNNLDENPQAQIETKAYINNKSATSIIKGYQTQFPFDTDLIESEEAIMALYNVGRNKLTGSAAEFEYVRVELFMEDGEDAEVFAARKFRVAAEIAGIAGPGAEVVHVTGNLNNVGEFVDGTFNIATKTFTAGTSIAG
jgi:hypothetical protein